jgi:hypothetical protein
LIGRFDEIRTTARPSARRSIRKSSALSAGLNSRPAWRNASAEARRADSEADSSGESDLDFRPERLAERRLDGQAAQPGGERVGMDQSPGNGQGNGHAERGRRRHESGSARSFIP